MTDLRVVTTDGGDTILESAVVRKFADGLRGGLLGPDDGGYDEARKVWNGMIDRRPALIARCAGVADVIVAVRFARTHELLVSVRGGGHNITGNAVCEGGLMIDLSPMKSVRVDPVKRTARAEAGLTWGEYNRETQAFGLASTGGVVSTTGIAGLTLGGGLGWLGGKHGLSCDNLLSADIVTADGEFLTASADQHPELFWGLRGGGGNFGVVVEFEFRLHAIGTRTLVAEESFPLDRAAGALRGWRDLADDAPRQATLTAEIPGDSVALGYVWVGDPEAGRALLPALRSIGVPDREDVAEMSYLALQTSDDSIEGHSYRRYWKGHYLPELSDGAIAALLDRDPADATLPNVSDRAAVGLQAHAGRHRVSGVAVQQGSDGGVGQRREVVPLPVTPE